LQDNTCPAPITRRISAKNTKIQHKFKQHGFLKEIYRANFNIREIIIKYIIIIFRMFKFKFYTSSKHVGTELVKQKLIIAD
jgi:hypothetical protein